jgi:glycine dehydrogenase
MQSTDQRSAADILPPSDFASRHIGPTDRQISEMLATLGAGSLDELIARVVPPSIRAKQRLDLPAARSERHALSELRQMAACNQVKKSMIGMGYYGTEMPAPILRHLFENAGWYTSYTPYQAEVSQGRLEALLNFQQVVMDMTGFTLANASLLDEATAAAEAMALAFRVSKSKAKTLFVDGDTHPQTIAVLQTRAAAVSIDVRIGDPFTELDPRSVFGVLLSYPGSSGSVWDFSSLASALRAAGVITIVATDLLALALLKPPAEWGADIAIGSAQRFGVPMAYGGPHAGFFATHDEFKRSIPGRIIGVAVDAHGQQAMRMALQTREQHIRRDRATSNICTAQALLAMIAGFYAVFHGSDGIRKIAQRVYRLTDILARGLAEIGHEVLTKQFFDTIVVHMPKQAEQITARACDAGINVRLIDPDHIGVAIDELTEPSDIEKLWAIFPLGSAKVPSLAALAARGGASYPAGIRRATPFLTHPVFSRFRSETNLMRYMRRLRTKDIALDRSMIPLGSCTMKLNAAVEMIPLSWPEFADLHPFAPLDQARGYRRLFAELEAMLCEITGFDAVSLQPNAGSQGEFAGLLTIRAYHHSQGQNSRDICLIPASAHGTNPASATLAGYRIVAVNCDSSGNVDVADLRYKAQANRDTLGALMITYPSTHGVFEEEIKEICEIVHQNSGQVYIDGANLNALIGIAKIAELGGDVCHMNLHKTFCIPHGGGGPGVGPIAVRSHLAPFLPGHPVVFDLSGVRKTHPAAGAVSAAPWGSPLVLPIAWAYIAMMGPDGLAKATKVAILNANYIVNRLKNHYRIVYAGPDGLVAHECIIDFRKIQETTGITVEDVAKRLIDFGFHAPTMSWPVSGTLMIEPTESEDKDELDRFCDALIAIRREIAAVERGEITAADCVLRHAPHSLSDLSGAWTRPYSFEQAFFPLEEIRGDKFWPPVGRIDNVAGDRQLQCACPPIEYYSTAAK